MRAKPILFATGDVTTDPHHQRHSEGVRSNCAGDGLVPREQDAAVVALQRHRLAGITWLYQSTAA